MKLVARIQGQSYQFKDLKDVFAKANEERSGDSLAGIAADSSQERIAAKRVLADLTLEQIRNNPLIPPENDEVSRIIEGQVNERIYSQIKGWTVAQLREWILAGNTSDTNILRVSRGLTSEMIAAATKLMSNMDLIHGAQKVEVITRCNTSIGYRGTLSSRLQPNHPTDSLEGMLASLREGLSFGVGDAVVGINPVDDSIENIKRLMNESYDFLVDHGVPTQNCVLAHVTTQMRAIEQGARVDMVFQSIAGTEAANLSFGISAKVLDEAYDMIRREGMSQGPNLMYFETGQGTELSANANFGVDQMTLEARKYGFAKYWNPFIVNTVVGFIGSEYLYDAKQVIRAGLEDHFMGKMHGLPMGVDVCYTNHIRADQNDMENLSVLLASAGVNFIIAVPMGDDCMLNYQSLSYHDVATLRETLRIPASPEFDNWLNVSGILQGGKLSALAGDPTLFSLGVK